MAGAFGLYRAYAAASIRSQLSYRASLVMTTIGIFLVTASEFVAVWALFDRFGQVRGWTLPEAALLYGMSSVSWAVCDAIGRGFDVFGDMVKTGGFDRLLLRPRSTVLQLLGQDFTLRRFGRLAQGLLVLGYAAVAGTIDWTVGRAVLLAGAIACGVCAFLGLLVLQATSAFWTIDKLEVWNAFTYGGLTMSRYPLPLYRPWFRAVFIFVIPLACVTYFPGVVILGRAEPLGAPAIAGWLAPLAGPAFLALGLQVWRIGIRHYRSTGS
ncbi:MAG: ABC transporter permease [Deltaproteobacteria bacterium]|nr:MAG: ABC transporter permease [Deltaproteobacteria bacterium]TMQ21567.1 MAG: ABC transporter permease [Deltaproteobacteria bacterium]